VTEAGVTVVVRTENAARTLRACLESIAGQSVRCGLVVVDCGSVDASKAIASGFADLVLSAAPNPSLQRNVMAMEDTDLGLRAGTRARVGRTSDVFLHDEGGLTFRAVCRMKARYATGIAAFRRKHGSPALASHLRRPYFEHPSLLLAQPTVGPGVLALKGGKAAAIAGRLLLGRRPTR
jgi:glycosyltransferase involved in cell wall biosynthesis